MTAVTISSRLVIFCQWKNELAIGWVGREGQGGPVGSNPCLTGKRREDRVEVLPFTGCYHITIDSRVMQ